MSTTRITIVKITGRLGEAINQLFQHWSGTMKQGKLLEVPLDDVSIEGKSISEKILLLTHALENHCDCESIIWFQQFVDHWTIAPCLHTIDDFESLTDQIKVIRSHYIDSLLLTSSDREVAKYLKRMIANARNQIGYSSERLYFLNQMRHCAVSWQPFLESNNISTIKLVVFHALGPSRLDSDIIQMATNIPEWFRDLYFPKGKTEEEEK